MSDRTLFNSLVDHSLSEIDRREPQYLARFPFGFPSTKTISERLDCHPALRNGRRKAAQQRMSEAFDYLSNRGLELQQSVSMGEPVAEIIFDSILDAFAAESEMLPIRATATTRQGTEQILADGYDERQTATGRKYVIGRRGDQPLVIVNALGIPLKIWNRLLEDSSDRFRIIVVENRCGDLFSGGMSSDVPLTQHAEDISEVLASEHLDGIHILGWCNGGRIAIELANKCRSNVRSLTLLSPTLRAAGEKTQPGSIFEDRLEQIFTTVKKTPALAAPLVNMISRFSQPPDWEGLASDASARAKALFALPALEIASAFLIPMSTPPFLLNYAKRTAADEAYPIGESVRSLAKSNIPALLITGSHDSMVSNRETCALLESAGLNGIHAEISGAGHYIQDLQYPYFSWLLKSFIEQSAIIGKALRVSVRNLGETASLN